MSISISRGEKFAILAAALWGLNYPMVKLVLQSVPENEFLVIRFTLSVILFVAYLYRRGENLGIRRQDGLRILALGVLGVGLYNILWTYGIHKTTAANAALLVSTSPIFTVLYVAVSGGEKLEISRWLGTLLAFAGIFFIVQGEPGARFSLDSTVFSGNLLVFASALLFAFYSVLAKPLLQHYSPSKLTALAMIGGLPVIVGYALISGLSPGLAVNWATGLDFTYIIVAGTVVAYILWYKGIQGTGPVKAVLYHYIVPVASMVIGAIMLGEEITVERVMGGILVFAGLFITKCDVKLAARLLGKKLRA